MVLSLVWFGFFKIYYLLRNLKGNWYSLEDLFQGPCHEEAAVVAGLLGLDVSLLVLFENTLHHSCRHFRKSFKL